MKHSRINLSLLALLVLLAASLACSQFVSVPTQQPAWTPVPVTAVPVPSANPLLAPTNAPTLAAQALPATVEIPLATEVVLVTTAPAVEAPATEAPATEVPPTQPPPTPTVDPHLVTITESDIANAIAGGAMESAGVKVQNLAVRFTGGKTWITADRIDYGLISVQNLTVVGRLVVQDGALQLETESVSPQGLVTAILPTLINQALKQYTSQWYVESVQTLEGRIELRIR